MITINGQDGGGQILRSALSLSMITGESFLIKKIRGARQKPGLMRQHLTCVNSAQAVCSAIVEGAELGSNELTFHPGPVESGEFESHIGTAGSTTLLMQTLLPALWSADGPSKLILGGGTHNPMAPPFEFIDRVYLPALRRMGVKVEARLESIGFAPVGGGRLEVLIEPVESLEAIDWLERGSLLSQGVRVLSQNLDKGIATRMANAANAAMGWYSEPELEIWNDRPSPGVACFIESHYENVSEISTDFGKMGRRAESVAHRAAKGMQNYLGSQAVVGRHLADQLLLPMALAGKGSFLTLGTSNHVNTNIRTIREFLDVEISIVEEENGLSRVVVGN